MREQLATRVVEGFFVGQSLSQKLAGFLRIADDRFRSTIGVQLRPFWSDENGNFEFVRAAENLVGEIVGDDAFVVVGKYERVEIFERRRKRAQQAALRVGVQRLAAFAIDANDVLMTRDDARLDAW